MTARTEHRKHAEALLEKASRHALTDPARTAFLAEAQVHALLALAPEDDFGTPAVPEIDAQLVAAPKPARRSRKAASAKESTK